MSCAVGSLARQQDHVHSDAALSKDLTPGPGPRRHGLKPRLALWGKWMHQAASGALRAKPALALGKAMPYRVRQIMPLPLQSLVSDSSGLASQLRQQPNADEPLAIFARLDPIHTSEFLHDLDLLVPTQEVKPHET